MANLLKAGMMMVFVAVAAALVKLITNSSVPIVESGEVPSAPPKHEPCPKRCMCFRKHTDNIYAVDIQCGDQNLSSVPQIIDNDIPISILNLSHNTLNNLTLGGYQSAKYLYLQYCELSSIDEKAFYGFKNLQVVDLSNNLLTTIPPNLFADNHLLDKLILRKNDLLDIDPNTPLLRGPPSLSSLDLQSCKLSTLSSATFSSLPNLRHLDIRRNELVFLESESLHFLHELEDLKVDSNPWKCGAKFEDLLCWMQRKLFSSHNGTLQCQHDNNTWEIWTPGKRSSLCCSSCKTDVTETTSVKPNASLSQETGNDNNTTDKRSSLCGSSCKTDVTETTIVNPNVSTQQATGNNWWWTVLITIVGVFVSIIACLIVLSFVPPHDRDCIFTKIRSLLCDNQTQRSETHTALRGRGGSTGNSQEGEEDENEELNGNETPLTPDSLR